MEVVRLCAEATGPGETASTKASAAIWRQATQRGITSRHACLKRLRHADMHGPYPCHSALSIPTHNAGRFVHAVSNGSSGLHRLAAEQQTFGMGQRGSTEKSHLRGVRVEVVDQQPHVAFQLAALAQVIHVPLDGHVVQREEAAELDAVRLTQLLST